MNLLTGPLFTGILPIRLTARMCDVRPRFLDKGKAGRGHRAIARNGRVLLASEVALPELAGRIVRLRFQTWHRSILPGELAEPFGILMCVRLAEPGAAPSHEALLGRAAAPSADLVLDVGGRQLLQFVDMGGPLLP